MRIGEGRVLARCEHLSLIHSGWMSLFSIFANVTRYRDVSWTAVDDELATISEMVASFDTRCRKMPRKLKEWEPYQVMILPPSLFSPTSYHQQTPVGSRVL